MDFKQTGRSQREKPPSKFFRQLLAITLRNSLYLYREVGAQSQARTLCVPTGFSDCKGDHYAPLHDCVIIRVLREIATLFGNETSEMSDYDLSSKPQSICEGGRHETGKHIRNVGA